MTNIMQQDCSKMTPDEFMAHSKKVQWEQDAERREVRASNRRIAIAHQREKSAARAAKKSRLKQLGWKG